ncbi:MAG: adenylate/guanylate cyclase domain-containing protein [Saprospiraceae bacterium]|nr:adenylate/guanylate cyclase domain-containing protein [Saprospiraceae bacterium]
MKHVNRVWWRMQINKILWITAIWTVVSASMGVHQWTVMYESDCIPPAFDLGVFILITAVVGCIAGLIGGSTVVIFFEQWIRKLAYGRAIALMLVIYSIVYLVIAIIAFFIVKQTEMGRNFGLSSLSEFMFSIEMFSDYIIWMIVTILTVIGLLVNDKYGPGVLKKLLTGQYFKPKQEERIFMFLDLRNSTAIAEQLSPEMYFTFLKEILEDITQSILNSRGEIYQYIGDEVVISWTMRHGTQHANCLRCFKEIQAVLDKKADDYLQKFGVNPSFKAGLHTGTVIAGEIGVIKRDVTYSGDVLNTASRIQGMCNTLGVDLLFSENLWAALKVRTVLFTPRQLGTIPLRGKTEETTLYTL